MMVAHQIIHDEPVHSANAIVEEFELMMLAEKNGVRIVHCGQGADEIIAGYSNYFSDYWQILIRQGRSGNAWNEIRL